MPINFQSAISGEANFSLRTSDDSVFVTPDQIVGDLKSLLQRLLQGQLPSSKIASLSTAKTYKNKAVVI